MVEARFKVFFCSCLKCRYSEQELQTSCCGQTEGSFSSAKGAPVVHGGYPWLHTNSWTFDLKLSQGSCWALSAWKWHLITKTLCELTRKIPHLSTSQYFPWFLQPGSKFRRLPSRPAFKPAAVCWFGFTSTLVIGPTPLISTIKLCTHIINTAFEKSRAAVVDSEALYITLYRHRWDNRSPWTASTTFK